MTDADLRGTWYLELVDQDQSDEEAERYGEYPHFGFADPPRKAGRTPYAGAILELRADGRYTLTVPEADWADSRGTWASGGEGLVLREAEDCGNGFDGLVSAALADDRLILAFKLVPDAHDGKDLLLLMFGREDPAADGPGPDDPVDKVLAADDDSEIWDVVDELDPAALPSFARGLWDAWAAGRLAADRDAPTYDAHIDLLCDRRVLAAGGIAHAHVVHALRTHAWYDVPAALGGRLLASLAGLPTDPELDVEIAALLATADDGEWLTQLGASRFLGGGVSEQTFATPRVPQPAADEASRAYLREAGYFTRFEAIERLYPAATDDPDERAELAAILIRYRGRRLLADPLALIHARALEPEAKAAALALLGDPDQALTPAWPSALMFTLVLTPADEPLPPVFVDALALAPRYGGIGGLEPDERALLRPRIDALPQLQREQLCSRLHLGP